MIILFLQILKALGSIKFYRNFVQCLIIITISTHCSVAKAEDAMDTIIDILSNLLCETQGVGDLLRSEFSHTCIPAPMFTFFVANLVSPVLYMNVFLRVKISDEELFPGACKRANRIDPKDPKLSFAMCNNRKLAKQTVDAVANSAVAIAKAMFTGGDPWKDIQNAWKISKRDFHVMYEDIKEGEEGDMWDIGFPPIFPWKVIKDNDKLCVATRSFSGWVPIGCKYIKEPFPVSIYANFMDLSPVDSEKEIYDPNRLTTCSGAAGCYQSAYTNSKTSIVMSGPLVECIKTMIAKLMISPEVCSINDAQTVLGSSSRASSVLFQFQVNMHKAVAGALTLYVILFGMKIILSGDIPEKSVLVNFVLKFLFVIYFSIGINIHLGSNNDFNRMDGIIEWVFPFLLGGMTELATWVINASPSELCKFVASEYPAGMGHIALWDSLDCRVSHYIGLDILQTMAVNNAQMNHDFSSMDILSYPIPPYIYLLIPAVISGNMTLVSLALMYPLMVISVAAFVVNATIVCMICIVIFGVLAPLFVPMLLFEYTKGYFDTYVKLMISFMLQPMVVVTFMTTLLSVYDFGFYGTCKYKSAELSVSSRTMKVFFVDNDWSSYTPDEAKGCVNSLGFILNNPLAFIFGTAVDISKATFANQDDPSRKNEEEKFPFLESIEPSPGLIFSSVEVVYEKIRKLVISLLTAVFTLYVLYHFSEQLAEFAADMTEGVSIGNMAIKPQAIFKAGMAAAGGKGKGGGGGGKGGMESAPGGEALGRGRGTDKASAPGGGAVSDKGGKGSNTDAKDTSTSGGKGEAKGDDKTRQWKSARPSEQNTSNNASVNDSGSTKNANKANESGEGTNSSAEQSKSRASSTNNSSELQSVNKANESGEGTNSSAEQSNNKASSANRNSDLQPVNKANESGEGTNSSAEQNKSRASSANNSSELQSANKSDVSGEAPTPSKTDKPSINDQKKPLTTTDKTKTRDGSGE